MKGLDGANFQTNAVVTMSNDGSDAAYTECIWQLG